LKLFIATDYCGASWESYRDDNNNNY